MINMIGSLKGGSGKSTLTFNLAVWLANAEASVLLIDADPQATLTDVAGVRKEEGYLPKITTVGASVLSKPEKLKGYDEVLIDVGTADFESLKKGLSLVDRIIVPVPPSQADIWSTQRFLKLVKATTGENMPEILGFINRADTHHAVRDSDEAAAALISLPNIKFVKPRLSQRTTFRRSFSEGLAVFEMDPRSKGASEWNALAAALFPQQLV